jgi:serine O-acetyltransferase
MTTVSGKTLEIESCAMKAPDPMSLSTVVEALCAANSSMIRRSPQVTCMQPLPSRDAVHQIVEDLRSVLFPGYFGASDLTSESLRFHLGYALDRVQRSLREQVQRGICFACAGQRLWPDCGAMARSITDSFLARLPDIGRAVASDVRAAFEGDPAAKSPDETIFCYPGVLAITNFRIAHALNDLDVPLLPRMITEQAHSITGIDIHPGAKIDEAFFIDHGTGVVIGETCIIGKHVRLYQGVTLGAKSFPLDKDGKPIKGIPRHPILEDEVIIYAGATILGRITIGQGSTIGGNVWVTKSLAPGSRVAQQQPRQEQFENGAGI